jgi:hypothetical protein
VLVPNEYGRKIVDFEMELETKFGEYNNDNIS